MEKNYCFIIQNKIETDIIYKYWKYVFKISW